MARTDELKLPKSRAVVDPGPRSVKYGERPCGCVSPSGFACTCRAGHGGPHAAHAGVNERAILTWD